MLSPEVWNFRIPSSKLSVKQVDGKETSQKCITTHSFNHMISIVIPDTLSVPNSVIDACSDDCEYYRISDVPAVEIINKRFLDAFIRRGELTLLSDKTRIDVDETVAVTPTGCLILTLNKHTYQELGLEGRPSFFQRQPDRYIIQLDIKANNFRPGSKNYERVFWCLKKHLHLKFDLLLAWDPPEENICPSSVAAYFDEKGYHVCLCQPRFSKRISYNVPVPLLTSGDQDGTSECSELLEWLGAFSVGVDLTLEPTDDFLTTYRVPDNCKLIGQVAYLSCTGFFTKKPILKLLHIMRVYTEERQNLPWASITVQGFFDSPTNWGLKEHGFFINGDNHYTLFLREGEIALASQVTGPNKKYKK